MTIMVIYVFGAVQMLPKIEALQGNVEREHQFLGTFGVCVDWAVMRVISGVAARDSVATGRAFNA